MKKVIILILMCCLVLSYPKNTYAMENEDCNGDLNIEEGAEEYFLTQEDIIRNNRKMENVKKINQKGSRATTYYTLDVPTFQQETNYYCGPATVKQTVHFIKGASNSQSFYANALETTSAGTDMTKIPGVLRTYSGGDYNYVSIGDYTNWCNQLIGGLSTGLPPILDINTKNVSVWPYATSGHFLNVSGYNNNPTVKVRVTDPYVKGLGNHWYSGPDVYAANYAHFRQAMIW